MSTLDAVTDPITDPITGPITGPAAAPAAAPHDNPRFRMRAYTHSNAIRLAAVLCDLCTPSSPEITREKLADSWRQRWPEHANQTGRGTVRARISSAVVMLRVEGIVAPFAASTDVTVTNWERLRMSAANLEVIVGDDGRDRTPSFWRAAISVPDDLRPLAEQLASGDLHKPARVNQRYQLRAYTQANPVRLAAVLLALDNDGIVSRAKAIDIWKQWWPQHGPAAGGRRAVSGRISGALHMLYAAGICRYDADNVYITDRELLFTAASNVKTVCDARGRALEPSQWPRRVRLPADLQPLEDELQEKMARDRSAGQAAGNGTSADATADDMVC